MIWIIIKVTYRFSAAGDGGPVQTYWSCGFSWCSNFIDTKRWTTPLNHCACLLFNFFIFFALITQRLTVIVCWTRGKNVDVFHFRPIGLSIFPVLSSSFLQCQSSVMYFWMSHWFLLEPDVLLDRILDVIFLSLDRFLDVEHCFAPCYQAVPTLSGFSPAAPSFRGCWGEV